MSSTDIADLQVNPSDLKLPKFLPEELLGLTFLREMDDGKSYRAKIVRQTIDSETANHKKMKFLVKIGEGKFDDILIITCSLIVLNNNKSVKKKTQITKNGHLFQSRIIKVH